MNQKLKIYLRGLIITCIAPGLYFTITFFWNDFPVTLPDFIIATLFIFGSFIGGWSVHNGFSNHL